MRSAEPRAGRSRCSRNPGLSNVPVSSSVLYSRVGPKKRSTPLCRRTPPVPSSSPNSRLYRRNSPKTVTSPRRISAAPRALTSRSLTPSIFCASMVVDSDCCPSALPAAASAIASVARRDDIGGWSALSRMLEFSIIHADDRRSRLERWLYEVLRAELRGARVTLTPASEDASFRRYFRATLDDGRSFVIMDAPPEKEDCRPFVHVARLLHDAAVHAPVVHAADLAAGFLLLSDLGTRTYLTALNAGNADALMRDATQALLRC